MIGQTIYTFFNSLYDNTYHKTVLYVTKKCDDPAQVSDIVQEIYTEIYNVY